MEDVKEKVRRLRTRLGLTQGELAERGGIEQHDVSSLETGRNKGSSRRIRAALAKAADVSPVDMDDYLEGRLSLDTLVPALEALRVAETPLRYGGRAGPGNASHVRDSPRRASYGEERYPNLQTALDYHGEDSWRPETVAAARTWTFKSDTDPDPKEWKRLLDQIEASLSSVDADFGVSDEDDEDPDVSEGGLSAVEERVKAEKKERRRARRMEAVGPADDTGKVKVRRPDR